MQIVKSQYIKFPNALYWNLFRLFSFNSCGKLPNRPFFRTIPENRQNPPCKKIVHEHKRGRFSSIQKTAVPQPFGCGTAVLKVPMYLNRYVSRSGEPFSHDDAVNKCSTISRVRCSAWTSRRICSRCCSSECVLDSNSSK